MLIASYYHESPLWWNVVTEGQDIIEYLVAHGAYVEAARLCVERGEPRRAIQLYERVWRFADAVPLALAVGDRPLALRLSLDAGDTAHATQIAGQIPDDARAELLEASQAFAGRGRPFEAGRAAERALDFARAAALYRRANATLDAGRTLELAGELHEAGLLYERLAVHGGDAEAAAARLALGRLLGRLGRHHEAARLLQQAAHHAGVRVAAQRNLVVELLSLGLRTAATEVLSRLRRALPDLPASPEAFATAEATAMPAGDRTTGEGIAGEVGLLRRRFRIVKLLGAGATGRVYLAHDTLVGEGVALKLLAVGAGATGPERQAYFRFAREAEAAGRLRHPNIVKLHDMDESLGLFVFELMAGGTLADRLAGAGPLSPAAGRRLAMELLAALGAAHERGIVHRDIKPSNVFFDAAGNAKLGDFGAAHLVDFGQTQTGGLVGTIAYMAPEQISGARIDAAADLYALGVTLFEALTGRPPFLGPDIVAQHLGEAPPAPSDRRAGLSPAHDETLTRVLAKSPGDRYASAQEMAAVVRTWPTEPLLMPAHAAAAARLDATGAARKEGAAGRDDFPDVDVDVDVGPDIDIGRSAEGRLVLRRHPRVGRLVLVEERDAPLDETGVDQLRALAAAGGPHVQRVLALSEDQRVVTYETIEGAVTTLEAIAPDERDALAAALRALHAPGTEALALVPGARVARTAGGPVILVAPVPLTSSSG
jgi:tetratricopeptide (TPR) repeat protein